MLLFFWSNWKKKKKMIKFILNKIPFVTLVFFFFFLLIQQLENRKVVNSISWHQVIRDINPENFSWLHWCVCLDYNVTFQSITDSCTHTQGSITKGEEIKHNHIITVWLKVVWRGRRVSNQLIPTTLIVFDEIVN